MGILRTQKKLLGLPSLPTQKRTVGMGRSYASPGKLHPSPPPDFLNTPRAPTSPPQCPHTNTSLPSNSHPSPPPSFLMPPLQNPPSPRQLNRYECNFNQDGVGRNRIDSFGNLQLNNTATERDIKVQYRQLARIYHPDKYDISINPTRKTESQEHFKLINNAYEFLQTF